MRLQFFGAAGQVTGSKTLITVDKEQYFVDYGLYQGGSKARELNWKQSIHLSDVSAIFLTHAHIDHSGLIPRLIRHKFNGKIYCTEDTYKLCEILLKDSAKIQMEDAEYANRKKYSRHKPALPLYTSEDVEKVLKLFVPVAFAESVKVSENVSIKFHWAGHILGASFIEVNVKESSDSVMKTIVFSGDIGHSRSAIFNPPSQLISADILVLESTYGNKLHSRIPAEEVLGTFLNIILKRQGVALIPSFSVGRTQEVLFIINKLMESGAIPKVPVVLDSPLSEKANRIFLQSLSPEFIRSEVINHDQDNVFPSTMREIQTVEDSKDVNNQKGPMIIVSASGMLDGGRVVHHVKARVTDSDNGIVFVGFQPLGTKGRLLIEGERLLRLHKQEFHVQADIYHVNALSAHADYLDTVDWLKKAVTKPQFIILNHGEPNASRQLKQIIETQLNIKTTVAQQEEVYEVSSLI